MSQKTCKGCGNGIYLSYVYPGLGYCTNSSCYLSQQLILFNVVRMVDTEELSTSQLTAHSTCSPYWQPEFFAITEVLAMGAKKHGADNWLEVNGKKSDMKSMHDSMFHHLAESFSRVGGSVSPKDCRDAESGLDPLLHLATRALMLYTRIQRGLIK